MFPCPIVFRFKIYVTKGAWTHAIATVLVENLAIYSTSNTHYQLEVCLSAIYSFCLCVLLVENIVRFRWHWSKCPWCRHLKLKHNRTGTHLFMRPEQTLSLSNPSCIPDIVLETQQKSEIRQTIKIIINVQKKKKNSIFNNSFPYFCTWHSRSHY